MTRVVITTRTAEEMNRILESARKLDIKFEAVSVSNKTGKNSEQDWISAGEPASDADLGNMVLSADSERGVEIGNAFRTIKKSLKIR